MNHTRGALYVCPSPPLPRVPPRALVPSPQQQVFINASLAINNSVDPSKRGTLNGLSVMLVSLATATGPTTFSTIFAWSINRRRPFPFDSHLIFVLLALGMVAITVTSWNVVFSRVETKPIGSAASPILVAEEVAQGVEDNSLSSGE